MMDPAPKPAAARVRAPDRSLVAIEGPDAESFLTRVVTSAAHKLSVGATSPCALLTPQGKIDVAYDLHRAATDLFLLAVHTESVAPLVKRLSLLRLRAKLSLTPRPDLAWTVALADMSGAPGPTELRPASDLAYHAARIAAGLPEQGVDFESGSVFPTDVNLDRRGGIDYAKGCFIGQEVVSRMKRRGVIRKRTLIAQADPDLLTPGAPVLVGGDPVGTLTSCAVGRALVLARLDRIAAAGGLGASFEIAGAPAILTFPAYIPDDDRQLAEPAP